MEVDQEPSTCESSKFRVNRELIDTVEEQNQELELQGLDITVYDHSTLGFGILKQVKDALKENQSGEEEEGEIKDDDTNESDLITPSPSNSQAGKVKIINDQSTLHSNSYLEIYLKKQSELTSQKKLVKKKGKPISLKKGKPISSIEENNNSKANVKLASPSKVVSAEKPQTFKRKQKVRIAHKPKKKKPLNEDDIDDEQEFDISSGSEYNPNDDYVSTDEDYPHKGIKKKIVNERIQKPNLSEEDESSWDSSEDEYQTKRKSKKELDDGDLDIYIKRTKSLKELDQKDCTSIDVDYRVPSCIWDKLFEYQQTGVKWLWGLHKDSFGGILGDEMGLGKTIQMISFLAGLHYSNEKDLEFNCHGLGPSIIVCPTTIMHQWVREFHNWYPYIRVAILHESGTFSGKSRKLLIKSVNFRTKGILITSYAGLIQNKDLILALPWHYVILDEGHKIRNPEAQITKICKNFDTSHRIILSGSPMQNSLKELWSLFDFIIPGKLGSMNIFTASFVVPINQGGFVNASKAQVFTAYKCASALKDTIQPYLLRRSKLEVDIQLPGKKEQVLFCKLTDDQRETYLNFLRTLDISYFQNNKGKLFGAMTTLRKICNHPDLYTSAFHDRYVMRDTPFGPEKGSVDDYGYWKRSGKLIVLINLLKHWDKIGGQKVLIFTQGIKMMFVLENIIKRSGYTYLKLDGGISIGARQPLIDKFNKDSSYFIMLLTTKVGGLGVNLTGANKVVIYDPDWNPATDAQARERAWRIGQSKDVCIYRLLTTGTIEEKMYHRQIFKEFLSNKILKDPKQRRFFKANDLMELFTLNETVEGGTSETAAIFAGTGSEIKYDPRAAAKLAVKKAPEQPKIVFSKEKLEEMKKLAQEMSKRVANLACKDKNTSPDPPRVNNKPVETTEELYGPDGSLKLEVARKLLKDGKDGDHTGTNEKSSNSEIEGPDVKSENSSSSFNTMDPKPSCSNSSTVVPSAASSTIYDSSGNESDFELSFADILKKQQEAKPEVKIEEPSSSAKKKVKVKSKSKDKPNEKNRSKKKSKHKVESPGKSEYAKFEGEVVPHLVKCRRVKKNKEEKEEEAFKNHDDYILHKLLKKSGIDTAMKHDSIMGDGPSDDTIVEEEASRVAEEALKAIQSSYHNPDKKNKNPLMQEIMKKLKERNLQGFNCGPQATALLTDLITYLNSMGGSASTNQVVNNFREKVDSGLSPIFRKLLNSIAIFYRAPDSKGYWSIKDEFKSLN